jgi:dihydrofolate synthase/folylpolyglutamate synthase
MFDDKPVDEAYEEALDYLYGLINYELKRHDRYMASKLDPTRPGQLMEFLRSPHQRFPAIHIAGTKGKGSVAAFCAACLQAAGLRVGLYTSPHVTEFRERIRILTKADDDGRIPKDEFTSLIGQIKTAIENVPGATWFEVVTAIAFLYFDLKGIDVAVIEVGLGGRLDATNVLTPLVSVITSVSCDHTDFLGETLAEIAGEKAGIIKPGIPAVSASQQPEAMKRIVEIAEEKQSPLFVVGRDWKYEGSKLMGNGWEQELIIEYSPESSFIPQGSVFRLGLSGAHQLENATVALAALSLVRGHFPGLTREAVAAGLENVKWIGRLQILHQQPGNPMVLVDCAHNVDSALKLRHALTHDYAYERLWLVLGITMGKDISGMMELLLPLAETTVATASTHPRATNTELLASLATDLGYEIIKSYTVREALMTAWSLAGPDDLICVTGSIFVVGDLLNEWEGLQSDLSRDSANLNADRNQA